MPIYEHNSPPLACYNLIASNEHHPYILYKNETAAIAAVSFKYGGLEGARTLDLTNANRMLSQTELQALGENIILQPDSKIK